MKFFMFVSFVTLCYQLVTPQVLRPQPFNFINRSIGEKIIETGNFINQPPPPTVISEPPCNSFLPIPNIAAPPSTTIITDCSPTICQNLANTLQLMIVCNLLQNTKSSDFGMQLAAPILNEVLSSPVLSCGCNNPLSPTMIPPSIIAPNYSPNVVTANYIPPNLVAPNVYSPNLITPNAISPNIALPPRVIAPTNACPNSPQIGPANMNGLINTIMSMLGSIQG